MGDRSGREDECLGGTPRVAQGKGLGESRLP